MKVHVVSRWVGGHDHGDREILGIYTEEEVATEVANASGSANPTIACPQVQSFELNADVNGREGLTAYLSHVREPEGLIDRTIELTVEEIGSHTLGQVTVAIHDMLDEHLGLWAGGSRFETLGAQ